MQKYSTNSYFDDPDMIFVSSSQGGGVIDFDKFDRFENILREIFIMPEYWRMKYIQQLGFVEHAIPAAHHTRLEHCVGAFDNMRSLIYWSNRNYTKSRAAALNFNLKEQAAQAAAFLHDIGHAFPGHPFERAIKTMFPDTYKNHEKWSLEIIMRSGIYSKLNSYSADFADKVLEIMAEDNLENSIWQQVHCGNLNVDTMDYLQRDRSRTGRDIDTCMTRKIIESVKFSKTPKGRPCVVLCPGAELDFMKMLVIRGDMFANVYFNGVPTSAEAFLPNLFFEIGRALDSQKYKSAVKSTGNPFIKFIASRGTDYEAYLNLTSGAFYNMVDDLSRLKIKGLSDIADKYQNIGANFSAEDVYKGDAAAAPIERKIAAARADSLNRGGIFQDVTVPLYDARKSEVYCMLGEVGAPRKFSEIYPEIANRKVRIISKLFMR